MEDGSSSPVLALSSSRKRLSASVSVPVYFPRGTVYNFRIRLSAAFSVPSRQQWSKSPLTSVQWRCSTVIHHFACF